MTRTAVAPEQAAYVEELERAAIKWQRDPAWLVAFRRRALHRFAETPFPTTHDEDWKYTNLSALLRRGFQLSDESQRQGKAAAPPIELGGPSLVFVDGVLSTELSRLDLVPGLTLLSLRQAIDQEPDSLRAELEQESDTTPFVALNSAALACGALVSIAPRAVVEPAIHVAYVSTSAMEGLAVHPRTIVLAGEASQATIVETYWGSEGQTSFTNAVTQVALAQGALVSHVKLQEEGRGAFHLATTRVRQEAASVYSSFSFCAGAALARNDLSVSLFASDASCTLDGVYLAAREQHMDNHTTIKHIATRTTSRQLYKGVLTDSARAVFNGKVLVAPNAVKTDAQQTNRNLVLSPDARVDTKPQLEIFADDVRCSHGATVGQLDEIMLFYLTSRGISLAAARDLLVYGFAREVVERIEVDAVRHVVEARLAATLRRGALTHD